MAGLFRLPVLLVVLLIGNIGCPPVDQNKPNTQPKDENDVSNNEIDDMGIEYNRYLKEVVSLLESDPEFRKKLESSDPEDIRTGKIAKELDNVNHHVRNKLDELKRQEMERLRHLAVEQFERSKGLNIPHNQRLVIPGHVDHRSPTFEMEDLRKLIVQTTKDLEEADKKRKSEYKAYEMQKEFEHQEKLRNLDEEKRKAEEKAWEESQKKHKEHPKLHHPGSKQQLEEVWEEQDHLDPANFNPKTFFALHDLDGNGVWDQDEVKALFTKELDKAYDPNAPEDDMAERYEEMERMREHVFNETDKNRDFLISFDEFLDQTKQNEFQRDPGWETLDEQPAYTHEEYMEFERRQQMEIQRLVEQGVLPPHPGMMPQHMAGRYPPPPLPNVQMSPAQAAQYQQQQQAQFGQPQFVPYPGQQQQFIPPPQAQQYAGQQQQWNQPPIQQFNQLPVQQFNQPPVQQFNQPPVQQFNQPLVQQKQQPIVQQQLNQPPVQQQPIVQQQQLNQPPVQQQQPITQQQQSNQQPVQQQPTVQQQQQPIVQQQQPIVQQQPVVEQQQQQLHQPPVGNQQVNSQDLGEQLRKFQQQIVEPQQQQPLL